MSITIENTSVSCGHNAQVSIAKALGIILMVMGHSGCPQYLHDFIYLFHMPLFYFLSAYFFRDEKVINVCGRFVGRKFKNLYWPYIKWSIIFLLLHNMFFRIGFYDNSLSWNEIFINTKRSIRGMWQGENMLGAYWFLISLFWESMLFAAIIWIKHKVRCRYFDLMAVITLFFVGFYSPVDFLVNREMVLLPIFYVGYLTAKRNVDLSSCKKHLQVALWLCLPVLAIMAVFAKVEVGQNAFYNPIVFLVGSIMGIYMIMIMSDVLAHTKMGKWLDLLGGATMSVLTFHFLAFKMLTWFLVLVGVYSSSALSQWPVPSGHGYNSLWLLYTIIGVVGPVACKALLIEVARRIKIVNRRKCR